MHFTFLQNKFNTNPILLFYFKYYFTKYLVSESRMKEIFIVLNFIYKTYKYGFMLSLNELDNTCLVNALQMIYLEFFSAHLQEHEHSNCNNRGKP